MKIDWVFDPTPPSGARTGGDVAEYAFTPGIEVFVREGGQLSIREAAGLGSRNCARRLRHQETDAD